MFNQTKSSNALALALATMLGAAAVAGAGAASAAQPQPQAQAQAQAPSVTVVYRDLDLSQSADVHTLYVRLQRAAASVCGPVSKMELANYMIWQRCYQSTLDSAVLSVRSPELLALDKASAGATGMAGRG
jgi:UrcA family protein